MDIIRTISVDPGLEKTKIVVVREALAREFVPQRKISREEAV